jgi:cytochrome c553
MLALAAFAALLSGAAAAQDGDRHAIYLAGTCAACHAGANAEQAIPGLRGKDAEAFVAAIHDYRSGQRKSQIMAAVTASLSDEDIALLARHFATLGQDGGAQ